MNKKYNKAVFEFFTADEDRFLMMGKIAQHEPKVKKELIQDFWEKLKQKLEKHFKTKSEDWVVRFSDDWNTWNNKIVIYKKDWCFNNHKFPLVCLAFESLYENNHPFLGILNRRKFYDKKFNIDEIIELLRATPTIEALGVVNKKNRSWAIYQHLKRFHLKDHENLANILPNNADKTMAFLIADAESLATALEDFMIEHDNLKAYKL